MQNLFALCKVYNCVMCSNWTALDLMWALVSNGTMSMAIGPPSLAPPLSAPLSLSVQGGVCVVAYVNQLDS